MNTLPVKIAAVALVSLCLPSCILIGNVRPVPINATDSSHRNVGSELLDLKRAKDQGLLSEEQYRKQHERILAAPCKHGSETKS